MKLIAWAKKSISSHRTGKGECLPKYNQTSKLPVLVFFQILKEQNLQLLNPENLPVEEEELEKIWETILDEYLSKIDNVRYKKNLIEIKQIAILRNELVGAIAAMRVMQLNLEDGDEEICKQHLITVGIYDTSSMKAIEAGIMKKKSDLAMLETPFLNAANSDSTKDDYDAMKTIVDVETTLGISIDVEKTTVSKWIYLYLAAINKNKLAKQQNGKRQSYTKRPH